MGKFWIQFAITEAVGAAQAYMSVSSINPELKASLQALIAAGQDVLSKLHLVG